MKLIASLRFLPLIALLFAGITGLLHASTDRAASVKTAMTEMIAEAAKLGAPRLDGSSLFFGETRINGNYTLPDILRAKHGCTSTFFVKKGDRFIRISTNVVKDDGSRAVGTPLDPQGPAIAAINQDQPYYGVADILGKKYQTGYEPVRDASGAIIGVYYIGYLLE
jgi:hypothetical protein